MVLPLLLSLEGYIGLFLNVGANELRRTQKLMACIV